jgi:large subunit ribosomal protein L15
MADNEREQLRLHHLAPAPGSKRSKARVGRGEAGKRGKTAGRGTKGLKARSKVRPGFEGGQMPLIRRIPKLGGFKNPNKEIFAIVNVGVLEEVFDTGATVGPEDLRNRGLIKHRGRVKVLAEGDLSKSFTVRTHAISGGARTKIEAAGGSVELIES